jgi:predicted nucleic acid-binding Zn ribbon protein
MIPIQQLMPEALAQVLRKAPMSPEKLAFAWRAAVGSAVANVTTIALRERVLYVTARETAWQREVKRAAPVILARLNAMLDGAVGRLDVKAASSADPSAGGSGSGRRRR